MSNAAGGNGASSDSEPVSEQVIVQRFSNMIENRRGLIGKIGELEAEWAEHKRVFETIQPMEPNRKAYQLINGVLVEASVGEVLPKIEANRDGIEQILKNLTNQLQSLTQQIQEYQTKYNIQVQRPGAAMQPVADNGAAKQSTGVLAM